MSRSSFGAFTVALLACLLCASAAGAAVDKAIHQIPFYVHEGLIDAGAGRDLAFYQNAVDQAIADANTLLQGEQGPFDSPCSSEIVALGATVISFSGLDASPPQASNDLLSIDFVNDAPELQDIVGSGSGVFLVDFLERCGTGDFPEPGNLPIGCASTPTCTSNADDDPDEITVLTMDALIGGSLGQTLAHERGHNTCLVHADTTDQCEIMRPAAGGGCLPSVRCEDYKDGRNACLVLQSSSQTQCEVKLLSAVDPALECVDASRCANAGTLLGGNHAIAECHATATTSEPDGASCSDFGTAGVCSGGTCDAAGSETATSFLVSADPDLIVYEDTLGVEVFDAQLDMSGKPGGWTNQGGWDNADEPEGLAYAALRDIVYGVVPTAGDDELIRIDPASRATLSRTTITGRANIIALTWDPGPTPSPSDDRLLGLESDGSFERLIAIDPDTASATTIRPLELGCATGGNYTGLAYDPANDHLYASSLCALVLLDCTGPSAFCTFTELNEDSGVGPEGASLARVGSGLSYSAATGNIYLVGNQLGISIGMENFRTSNYTVILGGSISEGPTVQPIDIDFVEVRETIGLDGLSVGGLAAVPVPEPNEATMLAVVLATLLCLAVRARVGHR